MLIINICREMLGGGCMDDDARLLSLDVRVKASEMRALAVKGEMRQKISFQR